MPHVDKVIISSDAALAKKYGAGTATITAAVTRLIAADAARGLTTQYIAVDGAAMSALGGTPVPATGTELDYKDAVDAIYTALTPDYIAILGAPDVFPHQPLTNPLRSPKDKDATIPSDLPYACAAKYSVNPADFIAPDRVVSRIPDIRGLNDPAYLETVLDAAATAAAPPAGAYSSFLGISADPWKISTGMSLTSTFGSSTGMQVSPSDGAAWTKAQWSALAHFINCHGAPRDWRFYGQNGTAYPFAHVAHLVAADAKPGTIVAAECCYGAELYEPVPPGVHAGIANTYLERGAFGFFGSTNIAYGPSAANRYADLICAYFFQHVLAGDSLGAATLAARQDYVRFNSPLDPVSLKTLAQFLLLGDPSIHAVPTSPIDVAADVAAKTMALESAPLPSSERRAERRRQATVEATELENSTAVAEGEVDEPSPDVEQKVKAHLGNGERTVVLSFRVRPKKNVEAKSLPSETTTASEPTSFHVAITPEHEESNTMALNEAPDVTRTMIQIATEVDGVIMDVKTAYSR